MRTSTRHQWNYATKYKVFGVCKHCNVIVEVIFASPGHHKLRRYTLRSGIIVTGAAPECDNIKGALGEPFSDHFLHCYLNWWYDFVSTCKIESNNPLYIQHMEENVYPYDLPVKET